MKIVSAILAASAMVMLTGCDKTPETGRNQSAEDVAQEMRKVSLQPGEWETTQEIVDMTLEGAPAGAQQGMLEALKGQKSTSKSCITPEQAANPTAEFLTAQKDSKCSYSGFEMANGTVKGAISCPAPQGEGKADISITGTYTPTSYAMDMEMKAAGMGSDSSLQKMAMHMKMKSNGKRIGECPAGK